MKRILNNITIGCLSLLLMLTATSCSRSGFGTVMSSTALGGTLGESIGWLRSGPHGAHRGGAIGTLVGAAVGTAAVAGTRIHQKVSQRMDDVATATKGVEGVSIQRQTRAYSPLVCRNFSITDENGQPATTLVKGHDYTLYFELRNDCGQALANVLPSVTEASRNKHLVFSSSATIPSIPDASTTTYRSMVRALPGLKNGTATIVISAAIDGGDQVVLGTVDMYTAKR